MVIVTGPADADAAGVAAELFTGDIKDQGFVSSHTRALSLNPEALVAWENLITEIARPMGKRRYELVTLAAALGARSPHCRLAHGRRSLRYFEEEQLVRIAEDYHRADLSAAEVTMMEFAERVSRSAADMTDRDTELLRDAGFSDREIVDIALAAAARNYYSRAVQALAVPVEVPEDISEKLRDALLRGV
ncbi:putative peroxidase-related enzyme [Glaciihabitans tibetensis]|uniref:Putative peroxidase-related enzyme n=1 Tax=Glaciihabitans tibetensis TaxID=1266600 RepID=A0A2T0VGP6_9MICO|nr:carboxymuconolactone decarboxylase [Glaciihabitans tibetensis]PRY69396.1 putative peroxidase-related enzyme [Glaciihabitans tibetensis]